MDLLSSAQAWLIAVLLATHQAPTCPADVELIEQKLRAWDSVKNREARWEIKAMEWPACWTALDLLQRIVQIDPGRPGAEFIIGTALGELEESGSMEGLRTVLEARRSPSADVRSWVALSLIRRVEDPVAVNVLLELAFDPNAKVRDHALSGLAHVCQARSAALLEVNAREDELRRSAFYWLSLCGTESDAVLMSQGLMDPEALIRRHSAAGLLRVGSSAGCATAVQRTCLEIEEQGPMNSYQEFCRN